jgi:hypothetical protein
MADKTTQLILDALGRAALHPDGAPLHGNKTAPGLFPATAAGRQAAQRCKDEGLLRVVGSQTRGKTVQETCTPTEKGLAHLVSQSSPKHVLEDFVRALEGRQTQLHELSAATRQTHLGLEALRLVAQRVLEQLHSQTALSTPRSAVVAAQAASNSWYEAALHQLTRWQAAGASEDCPLPALFRQVEQTCAGLSVGQFHDGMRHLHEKGQIYLHPWTGPLYDMPEPTYALLIGHEVLYYASLRPAQHRAGTTNASRESEQFFSYEYSGPE